jgi:transcriptional regulator GlxA family with amidase domain
MALDSGSDGLRLLAWLANLLANSVDAGSVATDAKLGADPALRPALRLIEEGLADPPRNAELAGAYSLSQTQFIRRFRAAFGETPQHMARKTRLRQAARSLIHTDLTIEAIAEQTGFADRVHFTHAFSKFFRVSPAAYRRDGRAEHITELDLS